MRSRLFASVMLVALASPTFVAAQAATEALQPAAVSQKLFIALYRRGPAFQPNVSIFQQPSITAHIKHHEDLGNRLIAAGPTAPGTDDLVGVIVIAAPDRATAERWFAADPAITSGVLTGDIRQWGASDVRPFSAKPR